MARFSGQGLPTATFNPALDTSGQSVAAGISQAGQALGAGIQSYIKNKVQKREDEEAAKVTADFLWKTGAAQDMGIKSREELDKYTKDKHFTKLLQMHEFQQKQEDREMQDEINRLKLDAAYLEKNKTQLASHGFTTGAQIRDYINRNANAQIQGIDLKDTAQQDALFSKQSQEQPLTTQLIAATGAGATDDDLLRMYRNMTGRGGIGVSQQNIGNKTVTFQTDATGTPTEIIPASSLGNNYGGGAGMQRPNYGPNNEITSYTQINADGSEGQTTFVHTNEPGSPLANLQNAKTLEGTSEDTVEGVYLRQMVPFNPQTISPQELNKITTAASQQAAVDRKGFVDLVNKNLNVDTTKSFTKGLQVGSKTLQLLDVAVSRNNLPSLQGAIKSFITQVEDGIVTDDEFQRFSDLGLFENFKKKFDEAGGRVTQEVAKELRTAALGLVEYSHDSLEAHIAPIKQQAMRTYDKIPSVQAERLARTSVDTELSNAKMLLGHKSNRAAVKLPEGVTQNMGKVTVRGIQTATGDISEVSLDRLVSQLGGKYTEAQLIQGLKRAYSDEVIQYLLEHIPTINEE